MDRNLRIRMLLEAGDRASRPLREIAGGSVKAAQGLKAAREQLKGIDRAQADIGSFRSLKAGLASTSVQLDHARSRATALGREFAQTANPSRALTREFTRARTEAQKLEQQHHSETRELSALRDRLRAAGIATGDLARHERELRDRARQTNEEIAEQERRVGRLADRQRRMAAARAGFSGIQDRAGGVAAGGAAALTAGVAVAAPLIGVASGAMDLEEGMAGVAKVTGMAGPQLQRMTDKLVGLSTHMPMTAVELSSIAAAAGAAGVGMDKFGRPLPSQADDLVAFTDAAARMGIAFDMTAEDAGSTMAKWRQAFKMTQPEVEALGDRVNALTNKFGGQATTVAGIITRIGPLGEVAGIAAPQVSALASSLNSIGVEEEVAATGIKSLLLNLTKGSAASKSQSKALNTLGLDATKLAKSMQVDASGTIITVLEKIRALSRDKQASILSEIFGTESVGAIAPLLTNLDGLKQRLNLVGDRSKYAGSMTAEFSSRISTAKGMAEVAKNSFAAVSLTLGQSMLPVVKTGALRLGAIALRMQAFATRHPELTKNVLIATGVLAALFFMLGMGGIAIAAIMGPIAILNAGLIALGVAGGIAAIPLLPIVAGLAAVAGAVALVVAAWNHWDSLQAAWFAFWGGLRQGFVAAGNFMAAWGPTVGRYIMNGLLSGLSAGPVIRAIWGIAKGAIGAFKSALGIHSPSRVFAGLGGYMMEGLAGGIAGGESQPIRRVGSVARRLTSAMAIGTIPATMAVASPATAGPSVNRPGVSATSGARIYNITVNQLPGQDAEALARAVADEIDRREREADARGRSAFADTPDYETV
ncbi:phage tail tape measure protein [Sphingomonas faeni]|uniref:phage tail tape measure protein n=1 Tax=Sphingomonas faeni TaxID=185950 RepID=UPI0033588980